MTLDDFLLALRRSHGRSCLTVNAWQDRLSRIRDYKRHPERFREFPVKFRPRTFARNRRTAISPGILGIFRRSELRRKL